MLANLAYLLVFMFTLPTSCKGTEYCNATLWREIVSPLLEIYKAAVHGFPFLIKAIDVEATYLAKPFDGSSSIKEALSQQQSDLCNFDMDAEINMKRSCEPEAGSGDPDRGICECRGLWQINVVEENGDCYAKPGAKCREGTSCFRFFSGWLKCYPDSYCKEDPFQHGHLFNNEEPYPYVHGVCTCHKSSGTACNDMSIVDNTESENSGNNIFHGSVLFLFFILQALNTLFVIESARLSKI